MRLPLYPFYRYIIKQYNLALSQLPNVWSQLAGSYLFGMTLLLVMMSLQVFSNLDPLVVEMILVVVLYDPMVPVFALYLEILQLQ